MSYNGWKNRETWLVNVHFAPVTVEDVRSAKNYIEEEWDKLPLIFKDFMLGVLSDIDWEGLEKDMEVEE